MCFLNLINTLKIIYLKFIRETFYIKTFTIQNYITESKKISIV